MILSRDNANDNGPKIAARNNACSIINYHFGAIDGRYKMFELLGEGVGANYYSERVVGLHSIDAIEYNKKTFELFYSTNTNPKITPYHNSMAGYLERVAEFNIKYNNCPILYDVMNMDFCQFYYPGRYEGPTLSGSENMEVLFITQPFYAGSLIFTTFMVKGLHTHLHKQYKEHIFRDSKLICDDIIKIADINGVEISSYGDVAGFDSTFLYNPNKRGGTQMMHACFVVKGFK